jgi:hypothetical protein
MSESRDEAATRTDVRGLATFSAALFLIVFGILRGNALGWTSGLILASLIGGTVLLLVFVIVEHRQSGRCWTSRFSSSVRGCVARHVLHRRRDVRDVPTSRSTSGCGLFTTWCGPSSCRYSFHLLRSVAARGFFAPFPLQINQ